MAIDAYGMTTTPVPARTSLSERVAEEIRAQMGRKQKTGADLARALGKSQAWISYRLSGKQAIDLNDLEAIAGVLGVPVADLFPADVRAAGNTRTT
jgi:transcriptional regulator with XRE-family HTH domain